VAIGPETKAQLPQAVTTPLGELQLKGRQEPLQVHLLISLRGIRHSSVDHRDIDNQ
jgi:hypothetical protein